MKKLVVFLLFVCMVSSTYAQQTLYVSGEDRISEIKESDFRMNEKANKSSAWFNMYQDQKIISGSYNTYLDFLFPDSTVMWVGSSGGVFVWKNAQGQVLDPTSSYWSVSTVTISEDANYRLDSIALPYAYRRTQHQNADTLLIQLVDADNMGYVTDPGWTIPQSYCRPDYDFINRKALRAIKEYKVPLTISDTAVQFSRIIQLEVGIDVDAGEEIAATIHFIPGNPYNTGDTLSLSGNGPGTINSFAIWDGKDANKQVDMYHYNHSLFISKTVAHNVNQNGWNESYIPGVAWNSGNYYTNIYFKITYDDYSGIENEEGDIVLTLAPNPANEFINVNYDLQELENATLEFHDVYGRKILTQPLDVNSSTIQVNVSKWNKGMYIHSLKTGNNVIGTGRVLIVD